MNVYVVKDHFITYFEIKNFHFQNTGTNSVMGEEVAVAWKKLLFILKYFQISLSII